MSTSPPIRRFMPEPIETSTRSSAKRHAPHPPDSQPLWHRAKSPVDGVKSAVDSIQATSKGRRFSPQPVEESTRSSRKVKPEPIETTSRNKHKGEPQEASASQEQGSKATFTRDSTANPEPRPARKFAPQPLETTPRSSKKFAPEPVETTKRSRRALPKEDHTDTASPAGKKKWLPEPVETTTARRRGKRPIIEDEEEGGEDDVDAERSAEQESPSRQTSGSKKYSPELLETARGSYKRGQPPHPLPSIPAHLRGGSAPAVGHRQSSSDPSESRFSAAALAKRHHQERQHSYIAPDLPIVQSDSSEEESDVPSLSATPSASSDDTLDRLPSRVQQENDIPPDARKLSLVSQERLLREQAMAAYINEKPHEPVDHYAIDREDEGRPVRPGRLSGQDGIDIITFRRDSAVDLDWHLGEMRKHHSQLQALKKNLKDNTAGVSRFSAAALASRNALGVKKKKNETRQQGVGLAEMRNAASPPMLGNDLAFPMSVSPKHTRLTPDQVPVPRKTGDAQEEVVQGGTKLWCANIGVSNEAGDGLWMGMCQKGEEEPHSPRTPMRSGIVTPAVEMKDPMGSTTPGKTKSHGRFGHGMGLLPLTPPRSANDVFTESLDRKLNAEQEIDREFHSGVITQVYNYLSLGYPALAHKFDEELSKISRVSLEDLRRDDERVDAKGHVGAPEGEGLDIDSVCEGKCARWTALRVYVHEWARQTPAMANKEREDWGVRARRGSWAF